VYDRQTDGQNYDSQDRASTAASRGKNTTRSSAMAERPREHSDFKRVGQYEAKF